MSKSFQQINASTISQQNTVKIFAWSLVAIMPALAIVAWGNDYDWQLLPINNYTLFPLIGLLAYSIMWSHYVTGTFRELVGVEQSAIKRYFEITSYAVLAFLLLHPALLIWQRFRDGAGLPPGSYYSYVAPGLGWVTYLGTISLFVFLAFELRRKYRHRSWWHFVTEAGDLAMLAIFYHGLRLGGQLSQQGWYRTVWYFMGLLLAVVLIRNYYNKYFLRKV